MTVDRRNAGERLDHKVVHVVVVQGLAQNIFFLDSGSRHTREDGVVDKRMQGDGRQNGSYR